MGKSLMNDFMALVKEMRQAQKSYFQTRNRDWLDKSKELERQVDKAIREQGQQRMFGE